MNTVEHLRFKASELLHSEHPEAAPLERQPLAVQATYLERAIKMDDDNGTR